MDVMVEVGGQELKCSGSDPLKTAEAVIKKLGGEGVVTINQGEYVAVYASDEPLTLKNHILEFCKTVGGEEWLEFSKSLER